MAGTLHVRWQTDKHVLVATEAMAKRLGHDIGRLLHVHAGQPFEMDADEAAARIESGEALEAVDPDELTAAQAARDAQSKAQSQTAVVLSDQGEKSPATTDAAQSEA